MSESLDRQGDLMGRIESAHLRFEQQTAGAGASAREEMLKSLATGFDIFQELQANLSEGTKVGGSPWGIPYSAKFSRRIIFAVFADSSRTAKIKLLETFRLMARCG